MLLEWRSYRFYAINLIIWCLVLPLSAQINPSTPSISNPITYPIKISPINIPSFLGYFIEAEVIGYDEFKITISYNKLEASSETFTLRPFTESEFNRHFKAALMKLIEARGDTDSKSRLEDTQNEDLFKQNIESLFFALKIGELTTIENEYEPPAVKICLNKVIKIYRLSEEAKDTIEEMVKSESSFKKSTDVIKKEKYRKAFNDIVKDKTDILNARFNNYNNEENALELLLKERDEIFNRDSILSNIINQLQKEYDSLENDLKEAKSNLIKIQENIKSGIKRINFSNNLENSFLKTSLVKNTVWFIDDGDEKAYQSWRDSIYIYVKIELDSVKDKIKLNERDSLNNVRNIQATLQQRNETNSENIQTIIDSLKISLIAFAVENAELRTDEKHILQLENTLENYESHIGSFYEVSTQIDEKKDDLKKFKENLKKIKDEEELVTAKITIKNQSVEKLYTDWLLALEDMPVLEFSVDEVEIEFNEGFIENIIVVGNFTQYKFESWKNLYATANKKTIKFENRYPLGFSRKRDFEILQGKNLFTEIDGKTYTMPISQLIDIVIQKHEVNRRDFSPKNHIYHFDKDKELCEELKKEATFRLFEAKVYSDFIGLNAQSPNGILQTEISRRINIRTKRRYWREKNPKKVNYFADVLKEHGLFNLNSGFFSYIEPSIAITKLEEDNKYLPLFLVSDSSVNGIDTFFSAKTIDLRRYENFNANLNISCLTFDCPNWKSTFSVNTGASFARVPLRDSLELPDSTKIGLSNTRGVNTFSCFLEIPWEIKADERYGFTFFWRTSYYTLLDRSFLQVYEAQNTELQQSFKPVENHFFGKGNWLNSFELFSYFNPAPYNIRRGRFFFRYRLTWEWGNAKRNFSQIQLGYSIFLLTK